MKEVICIKTHSKGWVKEGIIYPLLETKQVTCNCRPRILYNVGIRISNNKYSSCSVCNYSIPNQSGYTWFDSSLFSDLTDISELLEILNEEVRI